MLLRTSDKGNSWVNILEQISSASDITSIGLFDMLNGYLTTSKGRVVKTTDGGFNWMYMPNDSINALYGISNISADTVFAVGAAGTILFSPNGGYYWKRQSSNFFGDLHGLDFFRVKIVTEVGSSGIILRTVTGGE